MGGLGLDQIDDFQKFCGSGLDRIKFHWIRTRLGLKNFTVRSSLVPTRSGYDPEFRSRLPQDSVFFFRTWIPSHF